MAALQVISDRTAGLPDDRLNFRRYVDPIVSVLTDPNTETPFTIGIFGTWGSGKSTLLQMIDEELERGHKTKFVRVHFDPWVHRSEENMLVPLLHTLNDTLKTEESRFLTAIKDIGKILLVICTDILLKKFTANTLSLEKISEAQKTIMEEKGKVESEMRKLYKTLQGVADSVYSNEAKIVFFIDNLDRCQPDQIIDVLESVKLFLNLEHTFVLLAVDKEVIDHGIQVKYSAFKFGQREAVVGTEYLEKMVQLPLPLYPLQATQIGEFIDSLNPSQLVKDQAHLLQSILQPNPRKVKRALNILNITDAIANATPGLNLKLDLVARLVVLQMQSSDLYQEVLKIPDLVVALEGLYQKGKQIDKLSDFEEFTILRDEIQKLSKIYYQPNSYLSDMFAESSFRSERSKLPLYLSMLGG